MNLTDLFARAIDNRGNAYLPYTLQGAFSPDERTVIESALRQHVPEKVDSMFNNWKISKYDSEHFYAVRSTWESGMGAGSAQEMADKITAYYLR